MHRKRLRAADKNSLTAFSEETDMHPWFQTYLPLGSLWLSALAASIPIIFFCVALAGLRL